MEIFALLNKIMKMFALILLLLYPGRSAQALEPELRFDRMFDLGSLGGQTTLQDNDGFLWFGTEGRHVPA